MILPYRNQSIDLQSKSIDHLTGFYMRETLVAKVLHVLLLNKSNDAGQGRIHNPVKHIRWKDGVLCYWQNGPS